MNLELFFPLSFSFPLGVPYHVFVSMIQPHIYYTKTFGISCLLLILWFGFCMLYGHCVYKFIQFKFFSTLQGPVDRDVWHAKLAVALFPVARVTCSACNHAGRTTWSTHAADACDRGRPTRSSGCRSARRRR